MVLNALPGWAKRNFNLSRLATAGITMLALALQPFAGVQLASAATANITQIVFVSSEQTLIQNQASNVFEVHTLNSAGEREAVNGASVSLEFTSTSATGEFSNANIGNGTCTGNWGVTNLNLTNNQSRKGFCYKDSNAGVHTLKVEADGKSWAAATQQVTVNSEVISPADDETSPEVQFNAPDDGDLTAGILGVSVKATDDQELDSVKVDLYDHEDNLVDNCGEETEIEQDEYVLECDIDTALHPDGQYVLKASATDASANESDILERSVEFDNTAPVVELTNPLDGEEVSGEVDIRGSITDPNPESYKLVIKDELDSVVFDEDYDQAEDLDDSLIDEWDTTKVPNGEYTINLTATDAAGNESSVETKVTVNNVSPSVDDDQEVGGESEESSGSTTDQATLTSQLPVTHNLLEDGVIFSGEPIEGGAGEVLADEDEQPIPQESTETVESENESDECASLFGVCWYWWVGGAGIATAVFVLVRYLRGRES